MKTNKTQALYNLQLNEDELYSLGGWLKENAGNLLQTAAGVGMSFVPGLQSVGLPMAVSGASGLLGNATADKPDTIDYSDETVYPRNVGTKNMTPNVMHFKQGGKVEKVMGEFKRGKLHSGSKKGPIVKNRKQAIAIALSEAGLDEYQDGGLMEIEGPSHEQGGVQLQQGVEVEGGETVKNNVVNSDSWIITQDIADNYGLPKKAVGKTPAQYSKIVENKYKGREGDPFATKSKELESNNISQMSKEVADMIGNNDKKFIEGGYTGEEDPNKRIYPIVNNNSWADYLSQIGRGVSSAFVNPSTNINNKNNYVPGVMQYNLENNELDWINGNRNNKSVTINPENKESILDIPAAPPIIKKSSGTGTRPSNFAEGQTLWYGRDNVKYTAPSELDVLKQDTQPIGLNTSTTLKSSINAGTEPLATMPSYNKDLKFKPTGGKGLSALGNVDWGNVGQTAMGLAPMAVQAFMNARNKAEGYDKVKLPRLQFDDMNPQLIDPAYQVQQAQDAFATGNEQMSQVSKKDWLRRRIQSATEEGKATSGIRGATAAANTQTINQAQQFNKEGKIRTDLANLQTTMQEEQINAGNKAAWQTSRDYGLSNLGTMFGEYARDTRLEDANQKYNDTALGYMGEIYKSLGYAIDPNTNKPIRIKADGTALPADLNFSVSNPSIDYKNDYRDPVDLQKGMGNQFNQYLPTPRINPLTGKYILR